MSYEETPTNLSLKGIAEWTRNCDFVASGSELPESVPVKGIPFVLWQNDTPTIYISDGANWVSSLSSSISPSSITTDKIVDKAITSAKLADNSVNSNKLADSSVQTNHLDDKAVTTIKLADYSVDSMKLAGNSVTNMKLVDEAVTTNKIADLQITTNKLNNKSVTSAKIADDIDIETLNVTNLSIDNITFENIMNTKADKNTATSEENGLMSKNDKTKLDNISNNANYIEFENVASEGTNIGNIKLDGESKDIIIPEIPKGAILELNAKGASNTSIHLPNGVVDTSGFNHHGTAYGGVSVTEDGYSFDGVDGRIRINDSKIISDINSMTEWTLNINYKPNALPSEGDGDRIFAFNNNETTAMNHLGCIQIINNALEFYDRLTSSGENKTLRLDSIDINQQHEITISVNYNNSTAKLYIDGELKLSDTNWHNGNKSGVVALWFGSQGNSYFSDGIIKNVKLYPRALSASEIKSLYLALQRPKKCEVPSSLIFQRAPMDNSAGAWNGIYHRKNLLDEFSLDELSSKIALGDFSGIPIGSYIETDIKPSVDGAVLALSGNSTSGTIAYDISGNANNATMNNVTLSSDTDKAFVFNGTTAELNIPNITIGTSGITYRFMINGSDLAYTSGYPQFLYHFSSNGGYIIQMTTALIQVNEYQSSSTRNWFYGINHSFNENTWYDIAVTIDISGTYIYVDGVEIGHNNNRTKTLSNLTTNFKWNATHKNNQMKGLKFYNRALSAEEILQLHNATQDEGLTERVRWLVAGLDYYLHSGSIPINDHHLVMVAEDCLKNTAKMNATNTTEGGFQHSYFFSAVRKHTNIQPMFGNHFLAPNSSVLITNSVNTTLPSMAGAGYTGASNGWNWLAFNPVLMNEVELYGTTALSSSFFDVGNGKSQFPLFSLRPDLIRCGRGVDGSIASRNDFWLRSVSSSTYFCYCDYRGNVNGAVAATSLGVRPYFLFK